MKILHKIVILILTFFLVLTMAGNLLFGVFFNKYLLLQEDSQIDVLVGSSVSYFDERKIKYEGSVKDWGQWDETYDFAAGRYPDFFEINVGDETFYNLDINFFMVFDKNSNLLDERYFDLMEERDKAFPATLLTVIRDHLQLYMNSKGTALIMMAGDRYYLVALSGIRDSDGVKDSNGVLVIGREIDRAMLDKIEQVTSSDMIFIKAHDVSGERLGLLLDRERKENSDHLVWTNKEKERIEGHILLNGMTGTAPVILSFSKGRDIFIFGTARQRAFQWNYTLLILALTVAGFLVSTRIILQPVKRIIGEISDLDFESGYKHTLEVRGKDEFAVLTETVNKMLDKIQSEQEKLLKSEKRLLTAQEIAHVGNWEVTVGDESVWYSKEALRIMGIEQESPYIKMKDLINVAGPDEFERMHQATRFILESKSCSVLELKINRISDGDLRIIRWQAEPDCDENGNVVKIIGVMVDITAEKLREADIVYLSHHDTLTGLYNRFFLEEEMKRFETERQLPLSVIIGDINGLKLINDAFGHADGDKMLVDTAEILRRCTRNEDIIARIGGDEFCILLPQTRESMAQKICRRIYLACEEFNHQDHRELSFVSISLGCGTRTAMDQPLDLVIREAEESMYKHKLLERKSMHSSIMASIRATMVEKSYETQEHGERLVKLSRRIGQALDLSDEQFNDLELLSMLHDIGKIGIDSAIISKPGALTDEEWLEMKKHPEIGYRIASVSPELSSISEYILCHHERWDGKGYPQGLKGTEIPLLSRIIAIVDSYDAMTQDRAYRKSMSAEEAIDEIRSNAGTQFDPEIVDIFINYALMLDDPLRDNVIGRRHSNRKMLESGGAK